MEPRIGVYVCHCGTNIAPLVDVAEVAEFARSLPSVVVARDYKYMCSEPGQNLIKQDIEEQGLNRVVVASCSPRMHEPTFRRACEDAGLNPYLFEMANIREHCSWVHEDGAMATEKAKALVSAAVRKVYHHEPMEMREVPVTPAVLVVGGGIAGIQAALEIADAGYQVYLVEREPSIGGHMAQLDKTFPTLDCAACILTPKMVSVGQHPDIKLMTYSEVVDVSGYIGNFKVKIGRKARYVDEDKCTGCGQCAMACTVEVPSEFEEGLGMRKLIYVPFPQAVPNKYVIDKKEIPHCKALCKSACPIHMDIQGYLTLVSIGRFKEAYQLLRRTNPLPAVCGRVCYHPCEEACARNHVDEPSAIRSIKRFITDQIDINEIEIPTIVKNGQRVAIIGSGPAGLAAAHDLALKGYDVTIFEALPEPGGMLRVGIPEYRLPKHILSGEIGYIEKLGVQIKTNARVGEQVQFEDLRRDYQAIFIATGAHKSLKLGVPGEEAFGVIHGVDFLRAINLGQKVEIGKRVAVIGGGNTAIDAARVAPRLGATSVTIVYRRSRQEMPATAAEVEAAEAEGIDIMFLATPTRIVAQDGRVSKIECIRMKLGEPDASGRRRPVPVEGSEFTIEVDTVIPALGQASDLEFVNGLGLELSARGTLSTDEITLATNIAGVFAGGDAVTGPATVIDAIAAGKKAARSIDRYLRGEPLVAPDEVEQKGVAKTLSEEEIRELKRHFPVQSRLKMTELAPAERVTNFREVERGYTVDEAQREAQRCLSSATCSECGECERACDAKAINYNMGPEFVEVEVGSIIIATGFQPFNPAQIFQYGYGRYDNVVTSLQFERLCNASGPSGGKIFLADGREPESIGIIHCIGSRNQHYHEYCSKVCCMYSMKLAHLAKEKTNAKVYEFYTDLKSAGKGYEEFYNRVLDEGIIFVRSRPPEVIPQDGRLVIQCEDTLADCQRQIAVDLVVLSIALEPQSDAEEIARLFRISRTRDGFFLEKHPKLDPVATPTEGIFVVGCCQGPKDIPDTVAQASAAAARALAMISKGKVEIEATTAVVDDELCSGCKTCIPLCPYGAISFDEEKKASVINEALCKGCGTCAAACPSGAITSRHFTTDQIMAQIEGILV